MFKENDYVVYRNDVCLIKSITNDYYKLSPVRDNSLIISLPLDSKNIRHIMSKSEATKLVEHIKDIDIIEIESDRYLEQAYKNLLCSEDYDDLVKIIKTTYLRNKHRKDEKKKVGEIDEKYFELAENKLYDELSISLNMTIDEIKEYIFNCVNN